MHSPRPINRVQQQTLKTKKMLSGLARFINDFSHKIEYYAQSSRSRSKSLPYKQQPFKPQQYKISVSNKKHNRQFQELKINKKKKTKLSKRFQQNNRYHKSKTPQFGIQTKKNKSRLKKKVQTKNQYNKKKQNQSRKTSITRHRTNPQQIIIPNVPRISSPKINQWQRKGQRIINQYKSYTKRPNPQCKYNSSQQRSLKQFRRQLQFWPDKSQSKDKKQQQKQRSKNLSCYSIKSINIRPDTPRPKSKQKNKIKSKQQQLKQLHKAIKIQKNKIIQTKKFINSQSNKNYDIQIQRIKQQLKLLEERKKSFKIGMLSISPPLIQSIQLPKTKIRQDTPMPQKQNQAIKIQRWWRKQRIFSSKQLQKQQTPKKNPFLTKSVDLSQSDQKRLNKLRKAITKDLQNINDQSQNSSSKKDFQQGHVLSQDIQGLSCIQLSQKKQCSFQKYLYFSQKLQDLMTLSLAICQDLSQQSQFIFKIKLSFFKVFQPIITTESFNNAIQQPINQQQRILAQILKNLFQQGFSYGCLKFRLSTQGVIAYALNYVISQFKHRLSNKWIYPQIKQQQFNNFICLQGRTPLIFIEEGKLKQIKESNRPSQKDIQKFYNKSNQELILYKNIQKEINLLYKSNKQDVLCSIAQQILTKLIKEFIV